jgi:hypothetical protein
VWVRAMPNAKQRLNKHVRTNMQQMTVDVFSMLLSDPRLYNRKLRPATEPSRGSEFRESAVEGIRLCQGDVVYDMKTSRVL